MSENLIAVESQQPQAVTMLDDENLLVVAEQPGELMQAQTALIGWTQRKLKAIRQDLEEATKALQDAIKHSWDRRPFQKIVRTLEQSLLYYENVGAALVAGYCIVPNFPVEVIAIRTIYDRPNQTAKTTGWRPNLDQSGENTPLGEGEYVNSAPKIEKISVEQEGNNKLVKWEATAYREVVLPVKFMKPRVIDATQAAMAHGIFDDIGVLPARKRSDPIVVGIVRGPNDKQLSFMIAWFIDSRDL